MRIKLMADTRIICDRVMQVKQQNAIISNHESHFTHELVYLLLKQTHYTHRIYSRDSIANAILPNACIHKHAQTQMPVHRHVVYLIVT